MAPGRPREKFKVLFPVGRELDMMQTIAVRWIVQKRILLIAQHEFYEFLREQGVSTNSMGKGLKLHYQAEVRKLQIGSGTDVSPAKEQVFVIHVNEGSWLDDIMQKYLTEEELRENVPLLPPQTPDR